MDQWKLLQRMTATVLVAVMMMTLFPLRVGAVEQDMESLIQSQYDAYAGTLKPESIYDTAMRLVSHSIKGGGKLTMGQNDSFTAAMLRTEMFRASFVHAVTTAIEHMLASGVEELDLRGGFGWYDRDFDYYYHSYDDNHNGNDEDDTRTSAVRAVQDPYTGPTNGYDDAMILVVGRASDYMTVEKIRCDEETVTFRVAFELYDRFDFSGANYTGDDDSLAKFLTWLGLFLNLGGVLVPFDWSLNGELELTVPNTCTHSSGNYHWAYDGKQDLVSMTGDGFDHNPLTKEQGTVEKGVFKQTTYTAHDPIRLFHDRPWSLEIQCQGGGMFAFSEQRNTSSGGIYLRKAANTVFFGEYVYLNETDEKRTLTHYGVYFTKMAKITSNDKHTYLLTNELYEDGTNMVYLYIDGVSFGPMNQYYHVGTSQNANVDWVCGRDFVFRYVGNGSMPISDLSVDYIKVWENGIGGERFSYCQTETVVPTCTTDGYTTYTCALCGYSHVTDEIPAPGHSFGPWETVTAPSYEAHGEQARTCETCGHEERIEIPKLEAWPGDASGDREMDVRDVILLRQHLAGWDVDVNSVGADANGDGEVDVRDVILLRQYLAGWDVTLGTSE